MAGVDPTLSRTGYDPDVLFVFPVLAAEPDLQGSWTLGVRRSTVRARQKQAMEEALSALPSLVRGLARREIRRHLRTCRSLKVALDAERFAATCGGGEQLVVERPGPGTWRDPDGARYRTTVEVREDAVVMDVRNDDGGQRTIYRLRGDQLVTTTTLSAPRLPDPITWEVPYVREPAEEGS